MDIERLKPLAGYVNRELAYEWQRKASFETRAFAIVTANLAITTLFFAISAQLGLEGNFRTAPMKWLLLASLLFAALSTIFAVLVAVPRDYPAPDATGLQEMFHSIVDGKHSAEEAGQDVVEVEIAQLRAATKANDYKATMSIFAFAALAAAALALAAALILAVSRGS
jgi:hypothetical protein